MSPPLDPGALLARYYALPDGTRVCLRLLRPRDHAGTRDLCGRRGFPLGQLELARLTQLDPARRPALVATALIEATERVVGVAVVGVDEDPRGPLLLVVDEGLGEALAPLLREAAAGHAATLARARAA